MTHKKYGSIFLMAVIFIPVLLPVSFMVQQEVIRHQMLEALETKNLVTIIVKKSNLKWITAGKEIEVDGALFDVNSFSLKDDNYIIEGLYDKNEDALLQALEKAEQKSGDHPFPLLVSKIFSSVLLLENKTERQFITWVSLPPHYHLYNDDNFISFSPALKGPPPKI